MDLNGKHLTSDPVRATLYGMNRELLEEGSEVQTTPESNNYQRYLELGGIINEIDYDSILKRAMDTPRPSEVIIGQAKNISKFAGINLNETGDSLDERILLYGILSTDVRPAGRTHHHDQMSDQAKFVEALRMVGDAESVDKMIEAYPNINFKYQRG